MTSFYLRGTKENQEEYIERSIQKHQVPPYLVMRFEAPFSIKNAHELGTFLSMATGASEKRAVIIPSDMSIEAQNALLKKIEELDDNTLLFITEHKGTEVLPTVVSRLFEVRLEDDSDLLDEEIVQKISDIIQGENDISSIMQHTKFLSEYKDDVVKEVLGALRSVLLREQNEFATRAIEKIMLNLELYTNNNIHKRVFWDNVFLQSLRRSEGISK